MFLVSPYWLRVYTREKVSGPRCLLNCIVGYIWVCAAASSPMAYHGVRGGGACLWALLGHDRDCPPPPSPPPTLAAYQGSGGGRSLVGLVCYRKNGVDNQRHIVSNLQILHTVSKHKTTTIKKKKKLKHHCGEPNHPSLPSLPPFFRAFVYLCITSPDCVPVHYITRSCTCVLHHHTPGLVSFSTLYKLFSSFRISSSE